MSARFSEAGFWSPFAAPNGLFSPLKGIRWNEGIGETTAIFFFFSEVSLAAESGVYEIEPGIKSCKESDTVRLIPEAEISPHFGTFAIELFSAVGADSSTANDPNAAGLAECGGSRKFASSLVNASSCVSIRE